MLTFLKILDLGMNQLWGLIPPQKFDKSSENVKRIGLVICLKLGCVGFSELINFCCCRNLQSNGLTGLTPPEHSNLNHLLELRLDRNRLQGSVPAASNPD
ncbi:hypothetical protein SO802_019689 [Lithocarpus litseifolius]|uniref:Uncharacterized protein n=1 Tax=Lithocarpus litseifolius TaxID=425828 RepID=A0AAW2CPU2_9ROSI